MTALTARQRQVLTVIARSFRDHGRAPSIREMCDAMGIESPNGIYCHLLALARKGVIAWDSRSGRLRGAGGPKVSRSVRLPAVDAAVRAAAGEYLKELGAA